MKGTSGWGGRRVVFYRSEVLRCLTAKARLNRCGRLLLIDRVVVQHWPVTHAAEIDGSLAPVRLPLGPPLARAGRRRVGRPVVAATLEPTTNSGRGRGQIDRGRPVGAEPRP